MRKIIVDKDSRVTIAANWAITAILIGCAAYFIKNLFILTPIILFLLAFAFFVFWFSGEKQLRLSSDHPPGKSFLTYPSPLDLSPFIRISVP